MGILHGHSVYLLVSELNNAKITVRNFNNCFEWLSFVQQLASYIHSDLKHCNFLNTDISEGSVVTQVRFGGIVNEHFVANLLVNLSVEEF